MIPRRTIRQAMRAASRKLRRDPNARLTLKLNMWKEAKEWLAFEGPKPLCRLGAMRERAAWSVNL